MLKLDTTTRAAYDSGTSAPAKAAAVLSALANPVTATVYNNGVAVGSGTVSTPWATVVDNTLRINPLTSFTITSNGTPDPATWTVRFSSGSAWVEGSFGLTGSGADFTWSLATWTIGQVVTIGTATLLSERVEVLKDSVATDYDLIGASSGLFGWTIPETVYNIGTVTAGGSGYALSQHVNSSGGIPQYSFVGTVPAGFTVDTLTGQLQIDATAQAGTSVITVNLDNAAVTTENWTARSTQSDVVWAHRFESEQEVLVNYNPPGNADYANAVDLTVHPPIVCPHVGVEEDGTTYFEETLLGAVLDQDITVPSMTVHDFPTGTLAVLTSSTATITLPDSATSLGIVRTQSALRVVNGVNANVYLDVTSTPTVSGGTISFTVSAGARQQTLLAQSGLQLQHCVMGLVVTPTSSNPIQTIVIDEDVDNVGQWWPNPSKPAWSESSPNTVPADAYTVVIQAQYNGPSGVTYNDTLITRADQLHVWRDRLTVYRATYNPTTKKTTLVVRRASITASKAGDVDSNVVNRGFPCQFPSGAYIGRDNTGGWTRPFAALAAGENGLPTNDKAASGTVPIRSLPFPRNNYKFRTGYYGHADYHGIYNASRPFTPNTNSANGVNPYNGDEFWLSFNTKYSSSWGLTTTSSKNWFIDCYQMEKNSQVVGNAPTSDERRWKWFHNKGTDVNSDLFEGNSFMPESQWANTCIWGELKTPGACWEPPLDEWHGILIHIKAGHDNDTNYNPGTNYKVEAVVSNNGSSEMIVDTTPMPLKEGMTRNLDGTGGYFATGPDEGNPLGLDPQKDGYFNNWKLEIVGYGDFLITEHTMVNGKARYKLAKLSPGQVWPSTDPVVGTQVRVSWESKASARYNDTYLEIYKFEKTDPDWVLVSRLQHPITYSKGVLPDENPPGWNEFQPTGYANVNQNNMPPDKTRYIRTTEVILSHSRIDPPVLP